MKKVVFTSALSAIFAFSAVMPVFAAVIDAYNSPSGNVLIANYSQNPNSTSWSSSASASAGETVSVGIYYSNAGPDTARNVVLRLTPVASGSNSTYSFTGTITSDNAPTVTDSVTLNLTSAQTLTWQNQAYWAHNTQGVGSLVSTPNDLFGAGLHLGDVEVNTSDSTGYGTVVARFTVGQTQQTVTNDPIATTNTASNVQYSSATLNGQVDARGTSNVNSWIEWGNSSNLGSSVAANVLSSTGVTNITYSLAGLNQNSTYFYRVVAQRPGGAVVYGATQSFTTLYQGGNNNTVNDPSVTTNSASNVQYNAATLNGWIDSRGTSGVTYWFEYGQNSSYGYSTGVQSLGSTGAMNVSAYPTNLSSNTTYFYRVAAQRPGGAVVYGSQMTFATSNNGGGSNYTSAPSVSTYAATSVANANSMVLNGYLSSTGSGYNYANTWFEYGPDSSMGFRTNTQSNSVGTIAATVSSLNYGQTYYFRAVAQNSNGTSYGNVLTFTASNYGNGGNNNYYNNTLYTRTDLATSIYARSTVLNGFVQANNSSYTQGVTTWFEWGTTMSLGNQTPVVSLGYTTSSNISRTISGLVPATTYYYRAVAQDQNGNVSRGDIYRVTTANDTTVVSQPVTNTVTVQTPARSPIALSYGADKMRPLAGDMVTFRIGWRNESGSKLTSAVLHIEMPNGVTFLDSDSSIVREGQTLLYPIGTIGVNSGDVIYFRAIVDRGVGYNAELPMRITMNFTNSLTGQRGVVQIVGTTSTADGQGNVVTMTTVPASTGPVTVNANDNGSNSVASLSSAFTGTFFPQTAVGWLFFVLLLVLLGVLIRKYWMRPTNIA